MDGLKLIIIAIRLIFEVFFYNNLNIVLLQLFDPTDKKSQLDWLEAEGYCNALGGNLASFQNRNALTAVATATQLAFKTNTYWIGFNLLDKDKGYQWSDKSAVSFTNWLSGQPDNYNTIEECAEMRSNQLWVDSMCYLNRGWMCKINKGVIPPANPVIPDSFPGTF